ncbi:hypothetical protein WR25_18168 isoform B [Diploscapter pachys]|nr:hypothetical protein WR25_18168 isoform B [Diploscapter pachys]
MGYLRQIVLLIYLSLELIVVTLAPLCIPPVFDFSELLHRLNPLEYTFSTGILDLVILSFIRISLTLCAFALQQCKVLSTGYKCQTAVVFLAVFLYAFSIAKLLTISEQNQPAALWFLVSWNLTASVLHPIVWTISIKKPSKRGNYNRLNEERTETDVESGEDDERLSALWIAKVLSLYVMRHWHLVIPGVFCLCVYAITRVFIPDFIGRVIHAVAESGDMRSVVSIILWLAVLAFTSTLFGGFRGSLFTAISGYLSRDIRRDLFRSLVKQDIAFYDNTKTGDLISRLSSDTATVISSMSTNINVCSRNGIMIIGSIVVMLGISWRLTITCFVTAPAFAVITKYFADYLDKLAEKTQDALSDTNKKAEEVLSQMRTVRSFANEETEAVNYETALEKTVHLNNKKAFAYLLNLWITEGMQHGALIVVLLYGGYLVIDKQMSAGQLVTFFLYQMNFAEYVYWFNVCFTDTMASIGASRKVMKLMFRKPAFNQTAGELMPEVNGQIDIEGVHFTYPSRLHNPVLNDITLEVRKGETVALVGPSGGGKSSIVSLLERFYEPLLGCIYLDGTPISQFDHRYYHRKVCLVSQEPQLFSGTIKENIAYGLDECSEERIIEAAKTANAYDFIMKLEKQFDTECGERGVQLSGGQKQRIAISRAVVRDPAVLILDEATSALDAESEAVVQEAMNRCAKDRTVIVIAHRLSTIKNAQRIAVIEKGRIAQDGKRLERSVVTSTRQLPTDAIEISIDVREKHQQIFGFGGAFTDAAAININTLPAPMQDTILKQYFSPTAGIGYSFGRIPMASCDFSTHVYSYDDSPGDLQLTNFSLAPEDLTGKIPLIIKAQSFTANNSIKLFGSPWSAPGWMKQNGQMQGGGPLQGDVGGSYYQTFANYFVKFLEAYAQKGVKLWGLTMLNEPTCGAKANFWYQSMYMSPENERDFAKNMWGPAIRNSQYGKDLKLMILDDNRGNLPDWADTVFADPNASNYVDGVAVHWYEDQTKPAANLMKTHVNHPDKFLLYTEACAGWEAKDQGPKLGLWSRANDYAKSIIDAMNNWVTGWVDWNLALDTNGGPNW